MIINQYKSFTIYIYESIRTRFKRKSEPKLHEITTVPYTKNEQIITVYKLTILAKALARLHTWLGSCDALDYSSVSE